MAFLQWEKCKLRQNIYILIFVWKFQVLTEINFLVLHITLSSNYIQPQLGLSPLPAEMLFQILFDSSQPPASKYPVKETQFFYFFFIHRIYGIEGYET